MPLSEEDREHALRGQALVAAAVADTHAPQSLRDAIERDRERAARPRSRPWWRAPKFAAGAVAALAAAAIAVVLIAGSDGSGGSSAPSYAQVNAAARSQPTDAAPEPAGGTPPVLAVK